MWHHRLVVCTSPTFWPEGDASVFQGAPDGARRPAQLRSHRIGRLTLGVEPGGPIRLVALERPAIPLRDAVASNMPEHRRPVHTERRRQPLDGDTPPVSSLVLPGGLAFAFALLSLPVSGSACMASGGPGRQTVIHCTTTGLALPSGRGPFPRRRCLRGCEVPDRGVWPQATIRRIVRRMPRLQVYLPDELYRVVKERQLPASELLQGAVRTELRRRALLEETDRYLSELVDEVGEPSPASVGRAERLVQRVCGGNDGSPKAR